MKKVSCLFVFLLVVLVSGPPCRAAQYPWPVHTPIFLANTMSTLQFYGPMAGFHHGLDLKAPAGTPVYAPTGGRVEVGYYYPRVKVPYTYGVSLVGDDGYRWEFHHIDPGTVPHGILALAKSHGHVAPGTMLGRIYDASKMHVGIFPHVHVNVIDLNGFYQNPLNFFPPFVSKNRPRLRALYVVNGNRRIVASWTPGKVMPLTLSPGHYVLVLDISDVLGEAKAGDSLRYLSLLANGKALGVDDFSRHLPQKSFLKGAGKVYMIEPLVFADGKTLTNQTDPTRTRRFLYRFDMDLTRIPPGPGKNLTLKIFAQDFAKHSLRKSLELRIARGQ